MVTMSNDSENLLYPGKKISKEKPGELGFTYTMTFLGRDCYEKGDLRLMLEPSGNGYEVYIISQRDGTDPTGRIKLLHFLETK